ncbi:MAG: hypothetical protein J7521_06050 [Caulobacter sp.]|nr:hypothetical protein [Caulobacter sp.]
MGDAFKDVDVSRVIYLLLYLFLVIGGLSAVPVPRRKAKPPACPSCKAPVTGDTPVRGPWGGWTCARCGTEVEPPVAPTPRTGLRGWIDNHTWALFGAAWGLIIWGLVFARELWLHEPPPGWETFPLTVLAGFGIGWLLSLRRARG